MAHPPIGVGNALTGVKERAGKLAPYSNPHVLEQTDRLHDLVDSRHARFSWAMPRNHQSK